MLYQCHSQSTQVIIIGYFHWLWHFANENRAWECLNTDDFVATVTFKKSLCNFNHKCFILVTCIQSKSTCTVCPKKCMLIAPSIWSLLKIIMQVVCIVRPKKINCCVAHSVRSEFSKNRTGYLFLFIFILILFFYFF